jgi:hypothetical protein
MKRISLLFIFFSLSVIVSAPTKGEAQAVIPLP